MPHKHVTAGEVGIWPRSVNRRDALRLFIGAGLCATFFPSVARAATTQEKLDAAQMDYEQAQAALESIEQEVADLAAQLGQTESQIADVSAQIEQKQADIAAKEDQIAQTQQRIEERQTQLGSRMSSAYKTGSQSALDLIFSSTSIEELTSNIYYLDKVTENDRKIVEEVKSLKSDLETQKSELQDQQAALESQRSDLEGLQAQQASELADVKAKQDETVTLVNGLSAEVQQLMEQRDAELLAAQKAAEEARRIEEERKKQQAAQNQGGSGGSTVVTGSGSLADLQAAAYSTPSPGSGLCAAWVTNVFQRAGIGYFGGNACDMYDWYCGYPTSAIQPGMIVATRSVPYSSASLMFGHVGIYLGNGTVRDNASGSLRNSSLGGWVSEYTITNPVGCGWLGGVALS